MNKRGSRNVILSVFCLVFCLPMICLSSKVGAEELKQVGKPLIQQNLKIENIGKKIKLSQLRFTSIKILSQNEEGDWIEGELVNGKYIQIFDQDHRFCAALNRFSSMSEGLLPLVLNISLTGIDFAGKSPSEEELPGLISQLLPEDVVVQDEINLSKALTLAKWLAQLAKAKKLYSQQLVLAS